MNKDICGGSQVTFHTRTGRAANYPVDTHLLLSISVRIGLVAPTYRNATLVANYYYVVPCKTERIFYTTIRHDLICRNSFTRCFNMKVMEFNKQDGILYGYTASKKIN